MSNHPNQAHLRIEAQIDSSLPVPQTDIPFIISVTHSQKEHDGPKPLSAVFVVLSAIFLGWFTVGAVVVYRQLSGPDDVHGIGWLIFTPLFLWVSLYLIVLILWGLRTGLIGHPTLEMVGAASAAIIAAVTLALLFASGLHDSRKLEQRWKKLDGLRSGSPVAWQQNDPKS